MKSSGNSRRISSKAAEVHRRKGFGKVVIISSPSGGGKTTICRQLLAHNPDWEFSVSYTTRPMRQDEVNGREYFFVETPEFLGLGKAGFFAEAAKVHLHYYGTPRRPLEKAIADGRVILLDVDVQGAASIRKKYPQALSIFILPPSKAELKRRLKFMMIYKDLGKYKPSKAELKRRLKHRGTETKAQLAVRLANAIKEVKEFTRFDYVIINEDINEAVAAADHMIKSWTVGVTYFGRNKSTAYSVNQ